MNTKQCKSLRKAIREQHPNINKSMFKKLFKEGKRQFESLPSKERGQDIIEIK